MADDAQEIIGKWTVRVKDWVWEYEFSPDGKVTWRDTRSNEKGAGRWSLSPKVINLSWVGSSTTESWHRPITPSNQEGLYNSTYYVGKYKMQRVLGAPFRPTDVDRGPQVRFHRFLNSGSGMTGRKLGNVDAGVYITNGVELQFSVDPFMSARARNLRPQQWSGPEAIWIKTGNPLESPWVLRQRSEGAGSDNPEPQNVHVSPLTVAYYDSPGPSVFNFVSPRVSRIWVVQNFTGWVVGDRVLGGTERMCEVAAWHSVVSAIDTEWQNAAGPQRWTRIAGSRSGTGWVDVRQPPVI